jgi:hypothetical protein
LGEEREKVRERGAGERKTDTETKRHISFFRFVLLRQLLVMQD